MMVKTQQGSLVVNAAVVEALVTAPEAAVSGAPLPCPPCGHVIIIGAKEPKESKEPKAPARW
ncbi:hypothetical protein ACH4NF_01795 [Streptomyces sp. NPDC017248]|uniref:hypothetical protein n=1 Tax=unclassified Streptomyces TaxID=2593676 RepID=UPI00378D2FEC